MRIVDTDLLIIGSGCAGLWAAIIAKKRGIDPLVITKGFLSRSGCSRMSGIHFAPNDPKSCESLLDKGTPYHLGTHLVLVDHNILQRIQNYSPFVVSELDEAGYYFRRIDGNLATDDLGFPVPLRSGSGGMTLMDTLYQQTLKLGINFIEETMATSLLINNGNCVGATALNYAKGEFLVIRAKATVLATGHVGYVYRYTTQSREVTGDGIAMAYRAGAELINMEFQHWHMNDTLYPESARRACHNTPIWIESIYGKELLKKLGVDKWNLGPRKASHEFIDEDGKNILQELAKLARTKDIFHSTDVQVEVARRYGKRGELKRTFLRYNRAMLDAVDLSEYYFYYKFFTKFYDLKNEDVPVGTSAHTHSGGVRINERSETTIPGLYAAGGVAGIYPTTNACQWGGMNAVVHAIERIKDMKTPDLDWNQINNEYERVNSFLRLKSNDGYTPAQMKRKIRDLMWDKMWIIKTVAGMEEALKNIREMRERLVPQMGLEYTEKTGNLTWAEALEVINMIDVCELMILASLTRKESRGCFYVMDYPEPDDENWIKNIVIKRGEDGKPEVKVIPAINPGMQALKR
ncbi:MAG: FAD-binding protein [Candidatus Jordarchaeaceae archaeon]